MKTSAKNEKDKSDHAAPERLTGTVLQERHHSLKGDWELVGGEQLQKEFEFPDFRAALHFTNQVGATAEALNHHPDIYLTYGNVRLQISTHTIGGLTEADFKLAAKVNELNSAASGRKDKTTA